MLTRIREGFGRWVFVVILGLIAVSFVFWGVDFNLTGPSYAAKVNGEEIPLQEFQQNLQSEQAQFLDMYRVELDEELRRQLRAQVIDRMVAQSALTQRLGELGYRASDARVAREIRSITLFHVGGQFSPDAYRGQLAMQGMSPTAFEERQRQALRLRDLETGIARSGFVTPAEYRRYVELANQRREIAYASFPVESFVDRVEITDDEVAAHYEENADRYMTEEAVELEYVELRRADIAEGIEVSEDEVREYYEQRRDLFRTEEERRASHILITQEPGESEEEARARAEALVQRIRDGEDFDTLAAEHSDDPGSAASGGDLGWIGRGTLDSDFEEALYSMEQGGIEGPVRTDFGWHIIRFDDVREGDERTFDEVRDELLTEIRTERADDLYFERANQLGDAAFDGYDSLDAVAQQLDVPLERIERFPRSGASDVFPNSAPIVDVVFGFDPLETGINSDLIELSDEHVAVVRVAERFAPEQRPLAEVEDDIRAALTRERAEALAADAAEAFAAALPETLTAEFVGAENGGDETAGAGEPGDDAGSDDASGDAAGSDDASGDAAGSDDASGDAAGSDDASGDAAGSDDASGDAAGSDDAPGEAATGEDAGADAPAARLAAEHGGTWHGATWIERSDGSVPSEILAAAFDLPPPADGERLRRSVQTASGDRALVVLSDVEPGDPDEVPLDRRQTVQQQLLRTRVNAELGAYATAVQENASVTIPPEVLETQQF